MNNERARSLAVMAALLFAVLMGGCAASGPPAQNIRVLQAAPEPGVYRTLGMVSGQGATVAEAVDAAKARAAEMGADAVIVRHQHSLGNTWVVSVKAITILAPARPQ